jgi:hypothetical protein
MTTLRKALYFRGQRVAAWQQRIDALASTPMISLTRGHAVANDPASPAHVLRSGALDLIRRAEAIDGLKPFMVMHEHREGVTGYLMWFEKEPDEAQLVAGLPVEFDPDREVLTYEQLDPESLSGERASRPSGAEPIPVAMSLRPCRLYVEAFSENDASVASWASVQVEHDFVRRLEEMRRACVRSNLPYVNAFLEPEHWGMSESSKPIMAGLCVSRDEFWFSAISPDGRTQIRTRGVPLGQLTKTLGEQAQDRSTGPGLAWVGPDLYCSRTDVDALASLVAADLAADDGEDGHPSSVPRA